MLRRKIEKEIVSWVENSNQALLVYGVRQAGKTFIIRKCLQECKCDYVEFNLINQPEIVSILSDSTSIDDLILRLSLFSRKPLVPNKTFIFFDEIQRFKEIVTKIKFLVEDKRYRYVLSGLEVTSLNSAPVGYLHTLNLYPLDFEEFLQVFNVNQNILDSLKTSFQKKVEVDSVVHQKMLQLFNMYLIIGGMPAAIEKYKATEDINAVIKEHEAIIAQYKLDFTQYEKEDRKLLITQVYDLIPSQLNEKNKRFSIASLNKNLRFDRVQDSFIWLWKAGVALPVFNTTEPTIPLMLNQKSTLFKLFLSDVGLLTTLYGKATKLKILNNEKDLNKGAIYENVIAQELSARKFNLYYYSSHKLGELDFVIENNGIALPIEVKSGKDYERHSALNNVLSIKEYNIPSAIVFANCNVKQINNVVYYPIYMSMFLSNDDIVFKDISIQSLSFS